MNYKTMNTKDLTEYFLSHREDRAALSELRDRKGKHTITIPANTSSEAISQILKEM